MSKDLLPHAADLTYGDLVEHLRQDLHLAGTDLLPRSVDANTIGVLPAAAIRFSSGYTFPAGAAGNWTQMSTFGITDWAYAGMGVSSSGITVPQDGIYLVTAQIELNIVNAGFNWECGITVNTAASGQIWGAGEQTLGVGIGSFVPGRPLRLKAGDIVGIAVFTSDATGGSTALNTLCSLQAVFHSNTPANTLAGTVQ